MSRMRNCRSGYLLLKFSVAQQVFQHRFGILIGLEEIVGCQHLPSRQPINTIMNRLNTTLTLEGPKPGFTSSKLFKVYLPHNPQIFW